MIEAAARAGVVTISREQRFVLAHVGVAAAMLVAGLAGLDRAIAEFVRGAGIERLWILDQGTLLLDASSGKELSKFLVGGLLVAVAVVLSCIPGTRRPGRTTLFVGVVQFLSVLIAGVSKNAFGRLRPFQLLENGDWQHAWFVGGSAFPSGHAAFYFGLFLPLACVFPRWRWALMVIPWFIVIARVDANDHFLADVAASIVLCGLLALMLTGIRPRAAATP